MDRVGGWTLGGGGGWTGWGAGHWGVGYEVTFAQRTPGALGMSGIQINVPAIYLMTYPQTHASKRLEVGR